MTSVKQFRVLVSSAIGGITKVLTSSMKYTLAQSLTHIRCSINAISSYWFLSLPLLHIQNFLFFKFREGLERYFPLELSHSAFPSPLLLVYEVKVSPLTFQITKSYILVSLSYTLQRWQQVLDIDFESSYICFPRTFLSLGSSEELNTIEKYSWAFHLLHLHLPQCLYCEEESHLHPFLCCPGLVS